MARKSRRNAVTSPKEVDIPELEVLPVKDVLETAIYVRISVDKDMQENEESIETQAEYIYQFIENHRELHPAGTYIDRGYTGTNFDRPEFRRMMDDVLSGKIQCIVVKDLSRFGRNFLETGYYLENVLPRLNVRFISINDDLDSSRKSDMESIAVPIKNMVNELYAKDFSKKQTALFELHSQRGDAKILRSTYGYSLDRGNNRLVPNPETAPYVQIIYRWFFMGCGCREIIRRLNVLGVMTPFCYKATKEEGKPVPEKDQWRSDRVKTILCNQTYAGDTVYGKRRKILYKDQPMYHTKREDWIIHRNTHEPLIPREEFEQVREIIDGKAAFLKQRKEELQEYRERFHDSFPQKVKCMECGNTMVYNRYSYTRYQNGVQGANYLCCSDDVHTGCRQKVNEDFLRVAVMDQICALAVHVCSRKKILGQIKAGSSDKGALATLQRRIQHIHYELSETSRRSTGLYEDFAAGVLEMDEYREFKEHYILEKQRLQEELQLAEEEKRVLEKSLERVLTLENHLEECLEDKSFNQTLVDELIDSIIVSKSGKMEIRMKCADVIREMNILLEEGEKNGK